MKTKTIVNTYPFLSGGGELGELTRQHDWAGTSLGTPDQWPQSLRATLSIILNAQFPMFLWWGPELIQFYNDAYRPSLGEEGKHPAALGQKGQDCWSEIWPLIKPMIDQVLSGGEHTWNEDQLIPIYRNGKLEDVYWTFSYNPVKDESGLPAGVLVVCHETTGAVIGRKKLEASERRFRSIVEQAPLAVALFTGPELIITLANERVLEFWGRRREQVINKPLFEALPEARGQGFEELLYTVYTTGERFVANELPVTLERNGRMEPTYINFVYDPYYEPDGTISGILVLCVEITEQVVARRQVEESEGRLRAADRRKDDFLALLAHELRNPLAPIRNTLQHLTLTANGNEMVTWATQLMGRQVDQLVRLVNDLLDVSRISRGTVRLRPERIDLNDVIKQAVEASRPLFEAHRHTLTVELPASPLHIQGDTTRLIQVVTNLLTNAAKFTPEGGRVGLTLEHVGGEALLRVHDEGIGIDPNQLEHIFELFVQADAGLERSQDGLGVGLTLVRQLVELHGGRVAASSAGPGQGSAFSVRLPALTEPPQPQPASDTGTKPIVSRRILVVDDNPDAADTLAMLLKLKGFETHTRYTGQAGIAAAENLRPEVILLDIGMPGLNGYDTCRRIREYSWGQSLRVVALTGYGQEEDKRLSEAAGFDAHLIKPVDLGTLLALLTSLPTRPTHQ